MSTFKSTLSSVKYHTITRPLIKTANKLLTRYSVKLKDKYGNSVRKTHIKTRGHFRDNPKTYSKGSFAGLKRRQELAEKLRAQRSTSTTKRKYKGASSVPPRTFRNKSGTATIFGFRVTSTNPQKAPPAAPVHGRARTSPKVRASVRAAKSPPQAHPIKVSKSPIVAKPPRAKKPLPHGAEIYKKYSADRVGKTAQAVASSKTHGQLKRTLRNQAVRLATDYQRKPGATRKDIAKAVKAGRKKHGFGYLKNDIRNIHSKRMHNAAAILAKNKN